MPRTRDQLYLSILVVPTQIRKKNTCQCPSLYGRDRKSVTFQLGHYRKRGPRLLISTVLYLPLRLRPIFSPILLHNPRGSRTLQKMPANARSGNQQTSNNLHTIRAEIWNSSITIFYHCWSGETSKLVRPISAGVAGERNVCSDPLSWLLSLSLRYLPNPFNTK